MPYDDMEWRDVIPLLACMGELRTALLGNDRAHGVIKRVCTCHCPTLALFTNLFSSFSLYTGRYFPSPPMPSMLAYHLSLPSTTFPALEKSVMV